MSSPRLHEIAKLLGLQPKALMNDLNRQGFVFKTHMAAVDDKVWGWLQKKFPDLEAKWKEKSDKAEAAPKKPKAKAPSAKSAGKTSRLVTSRTKKIANEKKEEAVADEEKTVELLQRDEGNLGTVTLEQRVVKEGVIRRRRVETPPSPPPASVQSPKVEEDVKPVLESAPEQKPVEEEQVKAPEPVQQPVEEVVEAKTPAPAEPVKPEPSAPQVTRTPFGHIPSTGRNLSAPSRLRIVETPPPSEQRRAVAPGYRSQQPRPPRTSVPSTPAGASTEESAAERKRKDAAKKKPSPKVGEDAGRVTKRDLLGMVEEVEIQRPQGRRLKKSQVKQERKQPLLTTPGLSKRKIRIEDEISVADLAERMGIKGADVIRKLISMGQMATLTHRLDHDTATLVAQEYGYEVQNVAKTAESIIQADFDTTEADSGKAVPRPPIVTVMGHVDHGKTSLLDFIRKSRVAAGEAGGITQHIGAYQIEHNNRKITFIDTPGHAAFTSMRARGASLNDIVVLVVAADEGPKPQTLEALAHAKAAKVPIIVALNKCDKPDAKPDQVMQELSAHELVPEQWGGDTIYVKISALTGMGVPELLEMLLLQADVLELKADPDRLSRGVVIESRLDKGKGPVASIIVQTGTLRVGQPVVSGTSYGKVRALFDHVGKSVTEAGPSTPVEVLGFDLVPEAGDVVNAVSEDAIARKASELAQLAKQKADSLKSSRMSLEDMYSKMQRGEVAELRVILKGDVQGSVEAIADSLTKIKHEKVRVEVLFKAVGAVSESDVSLAAASGALILGFNVRPTAQAKALAERESVQIKTYEIIYELLDDVKLAMQGLLAPVIKENVLGQAEVREVFNVSKMGQIAGCYVKSGKIARSGMARLIRDNVVIYSAKIASLRRFKDDVREVAEGFECGIRIENYSDVKVGDVIECYEQIAMKQAV